MTERLTTTALCIIEHSDELEAAVARGEREIFTTPDRCCQLGPAYLVAMIAQARAAQPEREWVLWVGCGDSSGVVLSALRCGLMHLMADLPGQVMAKLQEIAAQQGATLRPTPEPLHGADCGCGHLH